MAVVQTDSPRTPVRSEDRSRPIHWPFIVWSGVAGGLGGLIGWLPGEAVQQIVPLDSIYLSVALYFAVVCAVLGAVLGALPGTLNRSRVQAVQGALIGALVAGVGGGLGGLPAQKAFEVLGEGLLARATGWAIVGAAVGLCPGVATRDGRRAVRGLAGGLAGGFLAGLLFDAIWAAVPHATGDTGTASRFAADLVVGIAIGLMVALVEVAARSAWLSVLSGKREGYQFILSKNVTTIGRDDRDDLLLWGDSSLALHHARVTRNGRRFVLQSLSPDAPTQLNGRAVSGTAPLEDGDEVVVGATRMLFRSREAAPAAAVAGRPAPDILEAPRSATAGPAQLTPADVGAAAQWDPLPGDFRLVSLSLGRPSLDLPPASTVRLGRGPANDVVVSDPTVSTQHAELRWEEGHWIVYDLGSTNGTYASFDGSEAAERRVQRNALRAGSTVRFGDARYRFDTAGLP